MTDTHIEDESGWLRKCSKVCSSVGAYKVVLRYNRLPRGLEGLVVVLTSEIQYQA